MSYSCHNTQQSPCIINSRAFKKGNSKVQKQIIKRKKKIQTNKTTNPCSTTPFLLLLLLSLKLKSIWGSHRPWKLEVSKQAWRENLRWTQVRTLFLFLLPSAPQCQKTWDGANSKETNWTEAGLLCPCHEATSTPEQRITIPILKNGKWKLFVIPEGISQVRMEEADAKLLTNITLQEETDRVTKEGVPQWETLICFIHSTAAALEVTMNNSRQISALSPILSSVGTSCATVLGYV